MNGQEDGTVRKEVRRLEGGDGGSSSSQISFETTSASKFAKPRMGRGFRRESLIQRRINSLFLFRECE